MSHPLPDHDRYYKQLEGATITDFQFLLEEDGEFGSETFPRFHATLKDGTKVALSISGCSRIVECDVPPECDETIIECGVLLW